MNGTKILAVIIIAVFLASLVPMNITAASPTLKKIDGIKHPNPDNFKARGDDIPGLDASSFYETATVEGVVPMLHPNSPWSVEVIDDYLGGTYLLDFNLFKAGVHCNIWIGLSTDVFSGYQDEWDVNSAGEADDEIYFAYPWSSTGGAFWGGPRLLPGYRDYIKGSQLLELINEFDSNIWATCKDYFGNYNDRPGPEDDHKINILIFNIRDGLFWDPLTAPYFIEGYYWGYIAQTYVANVIHIDTYQWFRRQGPTPSGAAPYVVTYPPALCRPYEYEGTFAHEYQHLIHRDLDNFELSWVTEGCSGLAQVICGYGFPIGHIQSYLDEWWQTSLVLWQGNLADYGATFLFTYYMKEQYGSQFIHDVANNPLHGIAGYNHVLSDYSATKNFDQIFQDWALANYLDGAGIYGYVGLDIPSANTGGYSIQNRMAFWEKEYAKRFGYFNWSPQLEGNLQVGWPYPYGTTLPYTVNYVQFLQLGDHALYVAFNGADSAGVAPHSPTHEWYSDGTAYSWFRLKHTFAIPSTGANLKFWSNYGIEENWDYGYVEVHDLNTDEWYTLAGLKTVSTLPNPQDNPYTPPTNEPTAYLAAGRWNAFTGSSDWYQEQMVLTPFAGHNVELYFTYWTDPYTQEKGWYIDDIEIPEIGFTDNVEAGQGAWTVNAGWGITTGLYEMDFGVSFAQLIPTGTVVTHLTLNDVTEYGTALFPMINNAKVKYGPVVMVMAAQPGYELAFTTTYRFGYQKIPWIITR
jgi:hypothetical protein